MTESLDPRRHPYRDDLAAVSLRGRVQARRFVDGVAFHVARGRAPMRAAPLATATFVTEALFGETFIVYDRVGDWAWGQDLADGYVGWIAADDLAHGSPNAPTHRVGDLRAFIYPEPSIKAPFTDALTLGTGVTVVGQARGFAEIAGGGWVFAGHLRPLDWREPDIVASADRLLGVPYLWGGRTTVGIDCSGLAQLVLGLAGIAAPRDADMQGAEVGDAVDFRTARRGDLVFFPGHVAVMRDQATVIHATAFSMTVTVEALSNVAERAGGIIAARRCSPFAPSS